MRFRPKIPVLIAGLFGTALLTFTVTAQPERPYTLTMQTFAEGEPLTGVNSVFRQSADDGGRTEQPDVHCEESGRSCLQVGMNYAVDDEPEVYCVAINNTPTGPEAAAPVTLTNNGGQAADGQSANHIDVTAVPGTDLFMIAYGMDLDGDTDVYAFTVDEQCNVVDQENGRGLEISVNNNNTNDGAVECDAVGPNMVSCAYLEQGNPDYSVNVTLNVSNNGSLDIADIDEIFSPTDIGRGEIACLGDGSTCVQCSAVGPDRPPEFGISCARLQISDSGQISSQTMFNSAAIFSNDRGPCVSSPGNGEWFNTPQLQVVEDAAGNTTGMTLTCSGSAGENDDEKNNNYVEVVELDVDNLQYRTVVDSSNNIASHHHCQFSGGTDEGRYTATIDMSPTDSSPCVAHYMCEYNDGTVTHSTLSLSGVNCAGGLISKNQGQNPGDEGRDYCETTTIPNVNYGSAEGLFPDSEMLHMVTYSCMSPGVETNEPGQCVNYFPVGCNPDTTAVVEVLENPAGPDQAAADLGAGNNDETGESGTNSDSTRIGACTVGAVGLGNAAYWWPLSLLLLALTGLRRRSMRRERL